MQSDSTSSALPLQEESSFEALSLETSSFGLDRSTPDFPPNSNGAAFNGSKNYVQEYRVRSPYDTLRSPEQEQKVDQFRKTLERHRGERQVIVLQDFPDPDALSSAWTYKLIAQKFDIPTDIVYAGTLSHQENIALVKLTGIPLQRWTVQAVKTKDLSL